MRGKPKDHSQEDGILTRATLISRLNTDSDEEAWVRFYETYQGVILSMARRWGLGETASWDVLQEVMLAVNKAAGCFTYDRQNRVFLAKAQGDPASAPRSRGGFRQWLFTIVKRAIWKQRYDARGKREISFCDLSDEVDVAGRIPSADPTPEEALDAKSEEDYAMALLEQAIRLLPSCTRRSHPRKIAIFFALKQFHVFETILKNPSPPLPPGHMSEMQALARLPREPQGGISKQSIMEHYGITSNHLDQEVKAIKEKLVSIFTDLRSGRDPLSNNP